MLLNAKQACGYLGIKAEFFRNLVNRGEIGFKWVNKSKRYPTEELDRWQKELTYIGSTKEVKRGGHTSPYPQNKEIIGLDALLIQTIKSKQNYIVPAK